MQQTARELRYPTGTPWKPTSNTFEYLELFEKLLQKDPKGRQPNSLKVLSYFIRVVHRPALSEMQVSGVGVL